MAWENFSRQRATISPVIASALWIAAVLTGARFTDFNEPYLPFAIAGVSAFLLRARLSRWEIYGWLLISALLVKVIHLPHIPFWILRVAASMALLGFGAAIILGLRAIWSEREGRENALARLAPALILIVFIFGCARVLSLTSGVNPQTDDAWLFAFDGSLGFQPSFTVGKIMYDSLFLTRASMLTYLALPFFMALVCAWQISRETRRISWYMLTVLLLAGVGGWLLYNVVPGTGPIYAFGQDFPWNTLPYRDLPRFVLGKMIIPTTIPRNAMPSLHVGWALLLVWNSRKFPVALRSVILIFLIFTVFATLGSGQHYLVDLIGSLPFALTVQAGAFLVFRNESIASKSQLIIAALAGLALTLAWLAVVRFGVELALKTPLIPWTLVLATASAALWLRRWISEPDASLLSIASKPNPTNIKSKELVSR
jgi:PAP2 superfamily